MTKHCYFFGGGKAEGNASLKNLLGGREPVSRMRSGFRFPRASRLR